MGATLIPSPVAASALVPRSSAIELDAVETAPCLVGFSLRVGAGERVALVGPNGVGKTTLLRIMAKLLPVAGGSVHASDTLGYVPQDYRASFLPWLSAERNLLLSIEARAVPMDQAQARLEALLSSLAIDRACLQRYPSRLSGGQQQLLALARALLARPRTLLLDEPFSALDTARRVRARAAVVAAAQETGATLVLVSHELDDVVAVAERVVVLDGRPARITSDLPLTSSGQGALAELLSRAGADA